MKKFSHTIICMAIIFTLFASISVVLSASPNGSLGNFKASKKFDSFTFSDVPEDTWFFKGVKSTYENSIMDGTGNAKFDPSGQVTKAQAIVIASRVHAIYCQNTIADINSTIWYAKFYDYAKANNLLPPSITSMDKLDETMASRSFISYLFNNVISQSDLSKLNDPVIPDLDSVNSDYKNSVLTMYSSGIITGKDGGNFDPDGLATRAEIATIITRLIDKTQRVENDPSFKKSVKSLLPAYTSDHSKKYTGEELFDKVSSSKFGIRFRNEYDKLYQASGFFINSDGTAIVDSGNLNEAVSFEVSFNNEWKKSYTVKILAIDDQLDISIIKINVDNCTYLPIGDSSSLKKGDKVYSISKSIISTYDPTKLGYNTVEENLVDELFIDRSNAIINELPDGKSLYKTNYWFLLTSLNIPTSIMFHSGPAINEYGEVVGIFAIFIERDKSYYNMIVRYYVYAIPINDIYKLTLK